MKALSIASIFALGLVGTACSQANEAPPESANADIETVETTELAADTSGFNLGLPTELNDPASAGDGFNLGLPSTTTTSTDGFNLGTDISASNGLSELPEVSAPIVEDVIEMTEDQPVEDEPVIRLD